MLKWRALAGGGMLCVGSWVIWACGDSSQPSDPFPTTVGAFCTASQHSSATPASGGYDVILLYNTTSTQQVTDDQGVVHQQTVRSCTEVHIVPAVSASSPEEAITIARDRLKQQSGEPGEFVP